MKTAAKVTLVMITLGLLAGCASRPAPERAVGGAQAPTDRGAGATVTPYAQAGQYSVGGTSPYGATGGAAGVGRTVYFDFDSAEIRADARPTLEANARYLAANPSVAATLEGHTDERGTREYNIGLGERRADSVRRALTVYGVPAERLRTLSYGEERPADSGHTEESYAKNRRVEIVY